MLASAGDSREWCMGSNVIAGTIATVVGGLILLVLGVWLGVPGGSNVPSPDPPSPSSEPVTFEIRDRLGPQQVSEQVTVIIDGERAGVLNVDQGNTDDEISHTASPGSHSYTVEATATFQDPYGMVYQASGTGQGTIEVQQGSAFEVYGSVSGSTWQISLIED